MNIKEEEEEKAGQTPRTLCSSNKIVIWWKAISFQPPLWINVTNLNFIGFAICTFICLFWVYNNISSTSITHVYMVLHILKKHYNKYNNDQPWGLLESFYFLKSSTYYSVGETMGVADFSCILSMIASTWFSTRNAVGLPTQVDKLSLSHWMLPVELPGSYSTNSVHDSTTKAMFISLSLSLPPIFLSTHTDTAQGPKYNRYKYRKNRTDPCPHGAYKSSRVFQTLLTISRTWGTC